MSQRFGRAGGGVHGAEITTTSILGPETSEEDSGLESACSGAAGGRERKRTLPILRIS